MKSGVLSTEFWMTLVATGISMAVLGGLIAEGEVDQVMALAKDAIAGVVAIVSLVTYIISRTNLKREIVRSESGTLPEKDTPQLELPVSETPVELG